MAAGLRSSKATFVSLLGADQARARVSHLAEQAKGHLGMFGERARWLSALVDVVANREA